ncbi:MAG: Cro/Cl family transcriptional regulator [Symbiopectobacterium sp.]
MERELLQTFNVFPKEDKEQMLKKMKEKKETMDKTVARWIKQWLVGLTQQEKLI